MDRFYYEIAAATDGAHLVPVVEALIAADPTLAAAAEPWTRKTRPLQSDIYALILIVSDGAAGDVALREKVNHAAGGDFPLIPVVDDVSTYDFGSAAIAEIGERNATGLNSPELLKHTLLHHGGLRLFGGGGSVFISYRRSDGDALALAINSELKTAGIGHTIDVEAFPGGDVIQDDIAASIRASDLVILVDSQGAARSRWVAEEMDIAQAARVPVIAVTPAAGGFPHAFLPLHVEWAVGTKPAAEVVAVVRRLLARKRVLRDRVARLVSRLSRLRSWKVATDGDRWLVSGPHLRPLRIACVDRPPIAEDILALQEVVGRERGLLVAGVRSIAATTIEALQPVGKKRVRVTALPSMAAQIPTHATKRPLAARRVFLSASMPSDADDVELAKLTLAPFIVALTQNLVELGGTLVFGGHPSVTPLVHRVVESVRGRQKGRVELHQAQYWRHDATTIPAKVREGPLFRDAMWHGDGTAAPADVAALRDGMIVAGLDAGVFVGGKTSGYIGSKPGVVDEYERFTSACPGKPAFVVGLAGGAARSLKADGLSVNDVLRTMADPDLAVALIVAELLGL